MFYHEESVLDLEEVRVDLLDLRASLVPLCPTLCRREEHLELMEVFILGEPELFEVLK